MNLRKLLLVAFTASCSFVCLQAMAQEIKVAGKVTTFEDYGLYKASVTARQSGATAYTDSLGFFSIVCLPKDQLVVEANGFFSQKVNLKKALTADDLHINLRLRSSEDAVDLATGFGHIDRNKLSHAIEKMETTNDFSEYASVPDIIKGRVSGLQVNAASISIRGTDTYNDQGALIVVDGAIVDFNTLKNLSTSQVKSVHVLKGASATARYGSRGMEGVILVQTKKSN
jgi:TonB-dependent SusC/RagA subfamily outer membrane receptor